MSLGIAKTNSQIPRAYFSIAKFKFSIAKTTSQIPSIYISIANSHLAGKSPFLSATKGNPKTVTFQRIRASSGQPRIGCPYFLFRNYPKFDGLGTTCKIVFLDLRPLPL